MASFPAQKSPTWYATDPLQGSGKNGTLIDEDFLSALYISKSMYHEMRNTCIRILNRQVEDKHSKVDLRKIWKKRDGSEVKDLMLKELISAHSEIFGDTGRLQHIPANWDTVKRTLAELCMILANAFRTRQLQRATAGSSEVHTPSNSASCSTTSISVIQEFRQVLPNAPHLLFNSPMILDNVVIPVVCGDRTVDILPDEFRRSSQADVPQFVNDISLDRLVSILQQEFQMDGALEVWGMNSRRFFIQLEGDRDLRIALISFMLFAWLGRQNPPCLEVRPLPLPASPR
jgi:hypothetical protein